MSSYSASTSSLPPLGRDAELDNRLEDARGAIEGEFLRTGEVLSQAVDGIGMMIAGLDKVIETVDPGTIQQTTDDLNRAAEKLAALPLKQAKRRATVELLGAQKSSLSQCIFDMRRSLDYMGAFAINIKIAASAIVLGDAEFGLFAQDISTCIELGRTELEGFNADVATLQRELQKALTHGATLERRCKALIPTISVALGASAQVMGDHRQRVAAAAGDAGRLARDIHTKVGHILAALQIGDITRQRIEHIQTALLLLRDSRAKLPPDQGDRMRGLVHSLLAAQLSATAEAFSQDVSAIDTSMAGLANDLQEVLRLRDLAYGRAAGEKDGFLRQLERRVEEALGLVIEIEAADRVAVETGMAVANAARGLTTRVAAIQTIKANVYYMAVNTTLKSSRIGEAGRPLSVIAIELHAHSGHLEASASACLGVLDNLTGSAATLINDGPALADDDNDTRAAARALTAAAQRIRNAGDRTERDITTLASQDEALLSLLDQPGQQRSVHAEISGVLNEVTAALTTHAGDIESYTDDLQEPLQAFLTKLAGVYTMAQERDVHQVFATAWGVSSGQSAALPSVDALEDVLF